MRSRWATCVALSISLEAIATTSVQSPCCIAGITLVTPILAVLRIPQRTFRFMLYSVLDRCVPHIRGSGRRASIDTRRPLLEHFAHSVVSRFRQVFLIEKQRPSLRSFRVTRNPTVLVREPPRLESGAAPLLQTGLCHEPIDVRLTRQVCLVQ